MVMPIGLRLLAVPDLRRRSDGPTPMVGPPMMGDMGMPMAAGPPMMGGSAYRRSAGRSCRRPDSANVAPPLNPPAGLGETRTSANQAMFVVRLPADANLLAEHTPIPAPGRSASSFRRRWNPAGNTSTS